MSALRRPRRASPLSRRASADHAEAATLALDASTNKAARKAFTELDWADQFQLAFEVGHTRRRELCIAYTNVVAVASGRKQTRSPKTGRVRLTTTACVIFVVRRKWASKTGSAARQALPRFLMAYWSVNGKRVLCAVPTDVVLEREFSGVKAQGRGVLVQDVSRNRETNGHFPCVVQVTNKNGEKGDYLLGCQHVFSPDPDVNAGARAGPLIYSIDAVQLGKSEARGGVLYWNNNRPDVAHSFDTQIAKIDNRAVAGALLGYVLSSTQPTVDAAGFYALAMGGNGRTPAIFTILAPPREGSGVRDIRTQFVCNHPPELPLLYPISVGKQPLEGYIHLEWAIGLKFLDGQTFKGDSGSPVVMRRIDGSCTLVGMHVGLSDAGYAVMVPAWQLFDGNRYTPKLASIRPVNP